MEQPLHRVQPGGAELHELVQVHRDAVALAGLQGHLAQKDGLIGVFRSDKFLGVVQQLVGGIAHLEVQVEEAVLRHLEAEGGGAFIGQGRFQEHRVLGVAEVVDALLVEADGKADPLGFGLGQAGQLQGEDETHRCPY